jgi:hypothetical protein
LAKLELTKVAVADPENQRVVSLVPVIDQTVAARVLHQSHAQLIQVMQMLRLQLKNLQLKSAHLANVTEHVAVKKTLS